MTGISWWRSDPLKPGNYNSATTLFDVAINYLLPLTVVLPLLFLVKSMVQHPVSLKTRL